MSQQVHDSARAVQKQCEDHVWNLSFTRSHTFKNVKDNR